MFGDRLRKARKMAGLTQNQLGDKLDKAGNTIYRWEKSKMTPREVLTLIPLLAEILGVEESFFTSSDADYDTPHEPSPHPGEPPVWIDVVEPVVCAGKGNDYYEISWEPVERYPFSAADLLGYAWHSGKLRIVRIEGSSMEPRYRDGDRVMFSEEEVTSGDVAIVLWDGKLLIRGYVIERDKTVHLRALNKENPEIVVYPEDERFQVLGKVLGRVSRFEPDKGFW